MKEYFRKNPDAGSIGVAPDDGLPRDFNPETVKINQGFSDLVGREGVPQEMSTTEEWIEWVNAVTREVNKEFPDKIISTNGYAARNMPPFGVKIDPNISIMFAAIWSDTLHAYDDPKSWQMVRQGELLQRWTELNDKVWIYGYDLYDVGFGPDAAAANAQAGARFSFDEKVGRGRLRRRNAKYLGRAWHYHEIR